MNLSRPRGVRRGTAAGAGLRLELTGLRLLILSRCPSAGRLLLLRRLRRLRRLSRSPSALLSRWRLVRRCDIPRRCPLLRLTLLLRSGRGPALRTAPTGRLSRWRLPAARKRAARCHTAARSGILRHEPSGLTPAGRAEPSGLHTTANRATEAAGRLRAGLTALRSHALLAGIVAVDVFDADDIVDWSAFASRDDGVSKKRNVVQHRYGVIGGGLVLYLVLADDVTNRRKLLVCNFDGLL